MFHCISGTFLSLQCTGAWDQILVQGLQESLFTHFRRFYALSWLSRRAPAAERDHAEINVALRCF
jgi:hypothetical protein